MSLRPDYIRTIPGRTIMRGGGGGGDKTSKIVQCIGDVRGQLSSESIGGPVGRIKKS